MGYSIHSLKIIKANLVSGGNQQVNLLFEFLKDQLSKRSSPYSEILSISNIERLEANLDDLSLRELEEILDFVIEQLPMCRLADRANRVLNEDNVEAFLDLEYDFYSNELRYSRIEKFIFTLTSI